MEFFLKKYSILSLLLIKLLGSGCSVWQSDSRKFLEEQGLQFAATKLTNFLSYQENDCSEDPLSHPTAQILTGDFLIIGDTNQWILRTYSQEQDLGFQQHFVQVTQKFSGPLLYCYPIITKVPTQFLSADQVKQFFAHQK